MTMKDEFGKVAVLCGGFSSEREVSLESGAQVCAALRAEGVDAHRFDPACEPMGELVSRGFGRVFLALHGMFGEDGTVQGALEYLQIPYTGAGVRAAACASDKSVARALWSAAGLPVARGRLVRSENEAASVLEELGAGLVVKPCCEGSSLGVEKLEDASEEELRAVLSRALVGRDKVLVEERVFGREATVGILAGEALPVIEIVSPGGNYDYAHKYAQADQVQHLCPAPFGEAESEAMRSAALSAWKVLGCRGWGRVDVMVRGDGSFVLLELNPSPGMTPHSLVPHAAQAVGLTFGQCCVRILRTAALDHRLMRR